MICTPIGSTRSSRTGRFLMASAVCCATLVAGGCGDSGHADGTTAGTHVMPDGTVMSDSEMSGMSGMSGIHDMKGMAHGQDGKTEHASAPGRVTHADDGVSAAAAMICSRETADAVRRNFALAKLPTAVDGWSDDTYRCDYQLPGGLLRLSVKDISDPVVGKAWFERVRAHTPKAEPIRGVQALGFPAFEAPGGQVGFLKDGRTLLVDAANLPASALPPGFSRTGVAYGVAAAVIACWSE